jgi:hypothetical protein
MPLIHDHAYRASLHTRFRGLKPDAVRQWGSMSPSQMLHHINTALAVSTGELTLPEQKAPLPRGVMKFLVLNLPWPKGAPTAPPFLATGMYDFNAERDRCLALIDQVAALDLNGTVQHPMFGRMSGAEVSRLQAKHLNHHLKQFGL